MKLFYSIMLIVALAFSQTAMAVQPDEVLADPVLEKRARAISVNLRCLVCQNQNIDDSDAPLAKDLRILVRERLIVGDSDGEVLDYVVDRYGEYVLLKPVWGLHTFLLWVAGPVILLFGMVAIFFVARKQPKTKSIKELSKAEKAALKKLEDV